jgi:hypothetical protein
MGTSARGVYPSPNPNALARAPSASYAMPLVRFCVCLPRRQSMQRLWRHMPARGVPSQTHLNAPAHALIGCTAEAAMAVLLLPLFTPNALH